MDTTVRININNRDGIEQIAADPDVKIKIKEAFLDEAVRRMRKQFEDGISSAIRSEATKLIHPSVANDLFRKSMAWESPKLTDDLRKSVVEQIKLSINKIIDEIICNSVNLDAFNKAVEKKMSEVSSFDLEKRVDDVIERKLNYVFGRKLSGAK